MSLTFVSHCIFYQHVDTLSLIYISLFADYVNDAPHHATNNFVSSNQRESFCVVLKEQHFIFNSAKVFLPAVNSTSQFFMVSSVDFMTLYYYFFYSWRVFYISVSRWFFTGVWVTASLLKSSGLFSVFWSFSVVWMVSTRPATCKSSSTFNNPLVIVPKAPISICIILLHVP